MYRFWLCFLAFLCIACKNTDSSSVVVASPAMIYNFVETGPIPGAEQLQKYVPLLQNKKTAVVVNQSSMVLDKHILDTLLQLEVDVVKIFVPEHGFRGKEDAGAIIEDGADTKTGLPIISLYGENKKPSSESLAGIETIVFDLQDVGVRCYTYISTLHYVMESCAELGIPLIVLDRPNPNGHYIDGPVLNPEFKSFVGMHTIPFVYGMTIGECARMIQGEKWINQAEKLNLSVIECFGYDHSSRYSLPVSPSPNLKSFKSVLLYPSLVFFEGTTVSVGRGTTTPFEVYGHPSWRNKDYFFKPQPSLGAQHPKHESVSCYGVNLGTRDAFQIRGDKKIRLDYLLTAFKETKAEEFFLKNNFIDKLAGTDQLRKQILEGLSEDEIRTGWEDDLRLFEIIRKKYLIYSDSPKVN